jgi:hypothetical protein
VRTARLIIRRARADKSDMPDSNPAHDTVERRRRARIQSATQGWLIPEDAAPEEAPRPSGDGEPWEIRVNDISRDGVGFESTERMSRGALCRIRIGRGPMRLARRIRVVECRPGPDGHYVIGGEFVPT